MPDGQGITQMADQLVVQYTGELLGRALHNGSAEHARCCQRLVCGLAFHLSKFQQHRGKFQHHDVGRLETVVQLLQNRQTALGEVESDVLEETVLAQACLEEDRRVLEPARAEFLRRFELRAQEAVANSPKFQPCHGRRYQDEMKTLWELFAEPRPRAAPRLDRYYGRTPLWVFIWVSLYNTYIDWVRRVQREQLVLQEHQDMRTEDPQGWDEECRQLISRHVAMALEQLPEEYQFVLKAIHIDDFTQTLVATILGKNKGTISRKLSRMVEEFKESFREVVDASEQRAATIDCLDEDFRLGFGFG